MYYKSLNADEVEKRFKELLKRNRLKPKVEKLVPVVFDKVWGQESKMIKWHEYVTDQRKTELKKKIKELAELARKSKTEVVIRAYESQIEEAGKELETLEVSTAVGLDLSIPYRTALDKNVGVLKNPVSTWDLFDVQEQHRLFFFRINYRLCHVKTAKAGLRKC